MENTAGKIIDALGGTTAVANMMKAPISTVHSWRVDKRIPPSRLAHMQLAAQAEGYVIDWERGVRLSGPDELAGAA